MSTQTIYARVSDDLKLAVDGYASSGGMTLANAVAELLGRGLQAATDEQSVVELEQRVGALNAEVETLRGREQNLSSLYNALAQRTALAVGTCPECGGAITGRDLLVTGHCPNQGCGASLSALLAPARPSKGSLNDGDFKLLLGALGLLLAIAFVSQQGGGG
jgi:uncharacterized small protein (DUF1192 family)